MTRVARKRKPGRPLHEPRPAPRRPSRVWMFLAWGGTCAVVAYGLHRAEPYARRIKIADTAIVWVGAPDWLTGDGPGDENWQHVLPDLEARVDLHPDTDPYDDRVCAYVAERLGGSAWIERVRRVSKQNDGRVRVYADFREPYAMVETNGVAYLVDAAGVRLPEQWASASVNRAGWLVVSGVRAPTPRPGHRWAGADVAAGLSLVRFLYRSENAGQMPFRDSIWAIDVGNFRGDRDPRAGRLKLVTRNPQCYIHWGLPPGEEYGIESTAELKLAMLREFYTEQGQWPDRGPIDVRWNDGIVFGEPN